MKYHMISGLPRSGSTLLSAILNQNPRFHASITSPLFYFIHAVIKEASGGFGRKFSCPIDKRKKIISSIFDSYYSDMDKEVAFDSNRGWGLQLSLVKDLYPYSKIIMCVREIGWILDSFEQLQRKNPYIYSSLFSEEYRTNVYTRCESLLKGQIKYAYDSFKQAIMSEHRDSIMIVEYEAICKSPEAVMRAIYDFIEEPYFQHDFNDVATAHDEFDADIQTPGLHTTRKKIEWIPRDTIIPPDIWDRVRNTEVWRTA